MKIKKKTINHIKITPEEVQKLNQSNIAINDINKIKEKDLDENHLLMLTQSGNVIRAFGWKSQKGVSLIPFVNPVLVYFNLAVTLFDEIEKQKGTINIDFSTNNVQLKEYTLEIFYNYYALSSNFLIMLFTSLEAFINQKIPLTATYEENFQSKYTKVYSYVQIQRELSIDLKMKKILPQELSKNFVQDFTHKYECIVALRNLRNEIIHTKMSSSFVELENLIKDILEFDYKSSLTAVKDFIEFYDKDLIEQSPFK